MSSIWWSQVTNAVRFANDIEEELGEQGSLVLQYETMLPWRDALMEKVHDSVDLCNSDKSWSYVDTAAEESAADDPGAYLLQEFCKPEKRAEYRPSKGYPAFFAEDDHLVLHDRYLWVRISEKRVLDRWEEFASRYGELRGRHKNRAAFILEYQGADHITIKKGLRHFSYEAYITEFDRYIYASLVSSGTGGSPFIKTYLAQLANEVTGNNIELCDEVLKNPGQFLDNPFQCVQSALQKMVGQSDAASMTSEQVERKIWLAQIKVVYPKLETYREKFVEKHRSEIARQLPIKTIYGETIRTPDEVELGTLKLMADMNQIRLAEGEYQMLDKYRDARNRLSHIKTLRIGEILDLQ